jgi:preprotein translocase subunit YajC
MIKIIVVMIVFILIGIMTIIQNRKRNKRIKELEKRLTDYYIQREQRLKDKGLI